MLPAGVVWCDDIPVKEKGSRGESAIGIFTNSAGDVGGSAMAHKSAAEMTIAAKLFEEECRRIEEVRCDEGRVMMGKFRTCCQDRDIIRAPLPPYSQHENRAEPVWGSIKPKIVRVLNRRKGKPPKAEWPYIFNM